MISSIPTTAARDAAGGATANGAGATGDVFAAKLQKAVDARQAAPRPTDVRTSAGDPIANEQTANDQIPNDLTLVAETPRAGDDTPEVDTAPHGKDDDTAATLSAGVASVVAPPPVAVIAPGATSSVPVMAAAVESSVPTPATGPSSSPSGEAASSTSAPALIVPPATASGEGAISPTSVPAEAASATTADPTTAATPVEPAPAVHGDTTATEPAEAPAPSTVTAGPAATNTVAAKAMGLDDPDDGDESKQHRGGSARGTAVAAGAHLVGPADGVVTGNVASQTGGRVGAAPAGAEQAPVTTHADHQAIARAADVLTTGEHAGPTTTNRLSLEMDGNSRVAVRMDDTGRFVRVDVLADPTGRLDGAWRTDISESLRNHGIELDQRGADTKGEGHHRKDPPDDRFATDGGLPRKPVRSRPARPGSLWL